MLPHWAGLRGGCLRIEVWGDAGASDPAFRPPPQLTIIHKSVSTIYAALFPSPSMGEGQGEGECSDDIFLYCPSSSPSPAMVEGVMT